MKTNNLSRKMQIGLVTVAILFSGGNALAQRREKNPGPGQMLKSEQKHEKGKKKHPEKGTGHYADKMHNNEWAYDHGFKQSNRHEREGERHRAYVRIEPYRYDSHHKPAPGFLQRMPHGSYWVRLDGFDFYVFDGWFYRCAPNGYYLVDPPMFIRQLPAGCREIRVDGMVYFCYYGIYFECTPHGFRILV